MYVEDDADDREFLSEAIKEANPGVHVVFAENGVKAIQFLSRIEQGNSTMPCLIVLDLNMPFMDGKTTFTKIKTELKLGVPVIIFTSSMNPADKADFNNLGVDFFTKPDNLSYMKQIVSHMIGVCCKE